MLVAAVVVYGLFDPSQEAWFPRCPFLTLTGWQCIGCGSQRALHALLHGHWRDVWHYNAAIILLLPYLLGLCLTAAFRDHWPQVYTKLRHHKAIGALIAFLLFWWVERNLWGWYI